MLLEVSPLLCLNCAVSHKSHGLTSSTISVSYMHSISLVYSLVPLFKKNQISGTQPLIFNEPMLPSSNPVPF